MQHRPVNDTLRGRILGELTRIIRRWVMLSVGVVGALAVGAGTYDAFTRLKQESELVATKLRADIDNTARQLQSLAASPGGQLWWLRRSAEAGWLHLLL